MGEAKEKMKEVLHGLVPLHMVGGMEEGVKLAWEIAQEGDVVLLSPACSSFDMFKDYNERGETYEKIVRGLAETER